MAEECKDTLEYILSCQVCFEYFKETGDHVPRLLPCTHTLCQKCVAQLIWKKRLHCPECRVKHVAENEGKSFPQNKYILINIRSKKDNKVQDEDVEEMNKCESHNKDLSFFCKDVGCRREICPSCMLKYHKWHDVIELEDKEKEELLSKFDMVKNNLQSRRTDLLATKENMQTNSEICLAKLCARKDELLRAFANKVNDLTKKVRDQTKKETSKLEEELGTLNEVIELLESTTENIEQAQSRQDIRRHVELVKNIEENAAHILKEDRFNNGQKELKISLKVVERLCLEVDKFERLITTADTGSNGAANRTRDVYEGTVIQTFSTGMNTISPAVIFPDGTVIVNGTENEQSKLKRFSLQSGEEIGSYTLESDPHDLVQVELAGQLCLAVAFGDEHIIEFRDIKNLDDLIFSSLVPHQPIRLCSVSSTSLLYFANEEPIAQRLDCSALPPTLLTDSWQIMQLQQCQVWDMHCTEHNGKEYLITTDSVSHGVHAYDTSSDDVVWSVVGKLSGMAEPIWAEGVTSDGRDTLFVCDRNNACVQMFSMSDGEHKGALLNDRSLGEPRFARWCGDSKCLVVSHANGNDRLISVVKLANVASE